MKLTWSFPDTSTFEFEQCLCEWILYALEWLSSTQHGGKEYVIVKFHHIINIQDQFMGMNTIQQPFLSCLPAFYALAIPASCYISNVVYYLKKQLGTG